MGTPRATRDNLASRFWPKVHKTEGCWEWTGNRHDAGYGRIRIAYRTVEYTHRVAWILNVGPIPAGMHVLHRCDNPPCVNPDHLFLGTHADNMGDMTAKGRHGVNGLIGSTHPMARLSEDDVLEMRRLAAQGVRRDALAARYGITYEHALGVIAGRRWAHLPGGVPGRPGPVPRAAVAAASRV